MEDYALIAKYEVIQDDDESIESSTLYKAANAVYEGKVPKAFQPFWAGGRLVALVKPNGKLRPIVIGESLRRLVGSVIVKAHKSEAALYFAAARNRGAPTQPPDIRVEAAQLGVGTEGGLEEIVHAVSVALQTHPFVGPGMDPNAHPDGWVCISVDFRNFFNSISRPAIFRTLYSLPQFADMIPFLSQLYSKVNPGQLWVDLGGEVDWEDILSREGVHQGCSFGSFLSGLGLQPVLEEVANLMTCGMVGAYCDDVKICGPLRAALQAYRTLIHLASERLGVV